MDGRNINQNTGGGNSLSRGNAPPERRAELQRLARRWVRFLALVEYQRRLDAGEPLVHLVHDDDA